MYKKKKIEINFFCKFIIFIFINAYKFGNSRNLKLMKRESFCLYCLCWSYAEGVEFSIICDANNYIEIACITYKVVVI